MVKEIALKHIDLALVKTSDHLLENLAQLPANFLTVENPDTVGNSKWPVFLRNGDAVAEFEKLAGRNMSAQNHFLPAILFKPKLVEQLMPSNKLLVPFLPVDMDTYSVLVDAFLYYGYLSWKEYRAATWMRNSLRQESLLWNITTVDDGGGGSDSKELTVTYENDRIDTISELYFVLESETGNTFLDEHRIDRERNLAVSRIIEAVVRHMNMAMRENRERSGLYAAFDESLPHTATDEERRSQMLVVDTLKNLAFYTGRLNAFLQGPEIQPAVRALLEEEVAHEQSMLPRRNLSCLLDELVDRNAHLLPFIALPSPSLDSTYVLGLQKMIARGLLSEEERDVIIKTRAEFLAGNLRLDLYEIPVAVVPSAEGRGGKKFKGAAKTLSDLTSLLSEKTSASSSSSSSQKKKKAVVAGGPPSSLQVDKESSQKSWWDRPAIIALIISGGFIFFALIVFFTVKIKSKSGKNSSSLSENAKITDNK